MDVIIQSKHIAVIYNATEKFMLFRESVSIPVFTLFSNNIALVFRPPSPLLSLFSSFKTLDTFASVEICGSEVDPPPFVHQQKFEAFSGIDIGPLLVCCNG